MSLNERQHRITFTLPCSGIVIELGPEDPDHHCAYQGGKITSNLKGNNRLYWAAMEAIESLVLAHSYAGVDVASPGYVEGIKTAVEACCNNLG